MTTVNHYDTTRINKTAQADGQALTRGLTLMPVMLLAGAGASLASPELASPETASRCFSSSLDGLVVASSARSGRETLVSFMITDS